MNEITVNDLSDLVKVIDVATERGAFRGAELSGIGGLRDRLVATLEAAAKAQQEASQQEAPAVEEKGEEA